MGINKKSNLTLVDDIGVLYLSDHKMIRAINNIAASEVKKLLASGLINELISRRLFPRTEISSIMMKDYALVLEHEKIDPVIYPFEWSPEMLRLATLCILQVNEVANKFGYELKDAHPYNVLFKYQKPMFVDFGSFVKLQLPGGWIAYDEFLGSFLYPLLLCKRKLKRLYKHMYLIGGVAIGKEEFAAINNPIFRFLGVQITGRLFSLFAKYRRGANIPIEKINARFESSLLRIFARFILRSKWLPGKKINFQVLRKRIKSINFRTRSMWADYHKQAGFYSNNGDIKLTPRMTWILDNIKELRPKTVLELGGNQGILSRVISKLPYIERVICTDYDDNAIDTLLLNVKDDEKLFMACFNFMGEAWQRLSNERANRINSEMVIALAVTHHLILGQHYNIEQIISSIKSYSSKYVIIEFMPLGLWDGAYAPPLPDWYNEKWFVDNLKCHCEIIHRKQLEENRIAFVGKIKDESGLTV